MGKSGRTIRVERLTSGFVVQELDRTVDQPEWGFTDAVDLADWLLDWLRLSHYDETRRNQGVAYERALDVVMAAQAYVEAGEQLSVVDEVVVYQNLVEAVKKWQAVAGEELADIPG